MPTRAGSGTDPEGQSLTYTWVQTGGPSVTLDDPNAATPSFDAPEYVSDAALTFELTVSDGTNTSVDTVAITVEADNDGPVVDAGAAQTVSEGDTVTLAGSGWIRALPDGPTRWELTSRVLAVASDAQASAGLGQLIRPLMVALRDRTSTR